MRVGLNPRGYTIIEVLIFMAVSGFMFAIAASFISGKQSKSEFKQGMSAINSDIQAVINDVGNGFYPSNSDFSCTAGPTGEPVITPNPSNEQGTNKDCVFGGKVIQFGTHGTNYTGYKVYSIAERQFAPDGSANPLPTKFSEAKPVIVPGTIDKKVLEWGMKVCRVDKIDAAGAATTINSIGFFQSFGSYSSGLLQSGAQSIGVIPIKGSSPTLGETESNMDTEIRGLWTDLTPPDPQPNVVITFDSGNGQYGTLTIGGGSGQRLTTAIKIIDSTPVCLS